jgi:hypothetical protein
MRGGGRYDGIALKAAIHIDRRSSPPGSSILSDWGAEEEI